MMVILGEYTTRLLINEDTWRCLACLTRYSSLLFHQFRWVSLGFANGTRVWFNGEIPADWVDILHINTRIPLKPITKYQSLHVRTSSSEHSSNSMTRFCTNTVVKVTEVQYFYHLSLSHLRQSSHFTVLLYKGASPFVILPFLLWF